MLTLSFSFTILNLSSYDLTDTSNAAFLGGLGDNASFEGGCLK